MILPESIKQNIIDILDSEEFRNTLYDGLDEHTRKDLGQFYTPDILHFVYDNIYRNYYWNK